MILEGWINLQVRTGQIIVNWENIYFRLKKKLIKYLDIYSLTATNRYISVLNNFSTLLLMCIVNHVLSSHFRMSVVQLLMVSV